MLADYPVHTTLPASDIERARRFYTETLGFTPDSELPGGILFRGGEGTRFLIFPSSGKASGTHTQMGFSVADLEAEVADLKGRGVVFEEYDMPGFQTVNSIFTRPEVKSAWFRDSEGNLIGLVQFL